MNKQENNVMEQILTFEGSELKTVVIEGKLYVVARELVKELGYKNVNRTVKDLNERFKIKERISTKGGRQLTTLVNQAGVLSLVAGSKREDAVLMLEWLANEVLPSIAKYGMYLTPEARKLKDEAPEEFEALYSEMKSELEHLEAKNARLEDLNKEVIESNKRLVEVNQYLETSNVHLQEEKVENLTAINALSDALYTTEHDLKEAERVKEQAQSICASAELPVHYALAMSLLMKDTFVTEFADITKGTELEIGRNTLYELMREMGLLFLTNTNENVTTAYGRKEGYVYDVQLTPRNRRIPFGTYTKPKLTQKGIALVFKELNARLDKRIENSFK